MTALEVDKRAVSWILVDKAFTLSTLVSETSIDFGDFHTHCLYS
jgi:hypothetical protein